MAMRVALLTARRTAGIEALLDDPNRGMLYDIACAVDSAPPFRNLRDRVEHDAETAKRIRSSGADYVFALAYPYVLTEPMLDAFPDRVICLHDGDLTEIDETGQRKWIGPHAVLDAILGGAKATRNSLYIITRDVGHGPLMLAGPRHPVAPLVGDAIASEDFETVVSYARLHRRWMRRSWGTILRRAIEILAAGTMQIIGDIVWIDGVPGPCRLGEAPDACEEFGERVRRDVPASCPFVQQ